MEISKTLLAAFVGLCLISISIVSCKSDASQQEASVETTTTASPEAAPAKIPTAELLKMDDDTRAQAACACFKKLNDIRHATRDNYQKGDTLAFAKVDTDLRETRREAKRCADELVLPLRSSEEKKKSFQTALGKTCPEYSTSILLMTKLNFKPE